jgi:hypothetical protein
VEGMVGPLGIRHIRLPKPMSRVVDTSRMANNVRPSLARRLVTLLHDYDLARKLLADIRQKRVTGLNANRSATPK